MRTSALLLATLALGSCGGKRAPRSPGATDDPAALAAAAWAREVPFALQAGYSLSVDAPGLGVEGSTRGGLVVHRPGRFRLEVFSPVGTPLLYVVSDGRELEIFDVRNNTFYRSGDAERLLREATGGAAGLDDLVSLMIGRLPFQDAEATLLRVEDGAGVFGFAGPEGTRAEVHLDERSLATRRVQAFDAENQLVLDAVYTDYLRVGGSRLPEQVRVSVPRLDLAVELEFNSWDELGRIPELFDLPQPPGSEARDPGAWLEQLKQAPDARPPG